MSNHNKRIFIHKRDYLKVLNALSLSFSAKQIKSPSKNVSLTRRFGFGFCIQRRRWRLYAFKTIEIVSLIWLIKQNTWKSLEMSLRTLEHSACVLKYLIKNVQLWAKLIHFVYFPNWTFFHEDIPKRDSCLLFSFVVVFQVSHLIAVFVIVKSKNE